MKRIALALLIALAACSQPAEEKVTFVLDQETSAGMEIPKYKTNWIEVFHKKIEVEPFTDYVLSGEASSSLPTLKSSAYLGVRFTNRNAVIKDREFLLFHDSPTPMSVEFNSGPNTEVLVFFGAWVNQTITLTVNNIKLAAVGKPKMMQEKPKHHFAPPIGWMNDPNGMVWKDGEWHLFYQAFPYDVLWGPMHWGHAVSRDLINWEHLSMAICPDEMGTIFSGSAVVDHNNTAGFGKDAIVAIYTVNHEYPHYQKQCIAYSTDEGRTFTKYKGNPVLDAGIPDFRDPKVSWNDKAGEWIMPVASGHEIRFYGSPNLKEWKLRGRFGEQYGAHDGIWECPDMFDLSTPDGGSKTVLLVNLNPGCIFGGSATQYFIGQFDGKTFIPDQPVPTKWMDYGKDHYATVSWNDAPDGRRVALAWMSNWQYARNLPLFPWRNMMSYPRDLSLVPSEDGGWLLASAPSPEVTAIRGEELLKKSFCLNGGKTLKFRSEEAYEIRLSVSDRHGDALSISLENEAGEKCLITIDYAGRRVVFNRNTSGLTDFHKDFPAETFCTLPSADVDLWLLVDKYSVELFVDGGTYVMTNLVFPEVPYNTIRMKGRAEKVNVQVNAM